MKTNFSVRLILVLLIVLTGCSEPPIPPDVQRAFAQEQDLWRAGANVYARDSYAEYQVALKAGRDRLSVEQSRFSWFRDYAGVATYFSDILARGEQVHQELAQTRGRQTNELLNRSLRIVERLHALRDLAGAVKDSRLNTGGLARVEVQMKEAKSFAESGQTVQALDRVAEAEVLLDKTVDAIRPFLAKFMDSRQISHWKALVDAVVAENQQRGGYAIVVNKLRRQLLLYRKGEKVASYAIGLGFNPIGDKLYAGDRATPEGRYEVVGKLPNSKFHRALLINYPNAEDQQRFAEAKRRKRIPANAKIGGLIEIHGGGKDAATLGCIGLDNSHMQELFSRVEIGTPVVIVAAMNTDNLVSLALGQLE
jgi:hypothetical protein